MFIFLLKAWIIGIAVAAPVGPIGMLCIRKTLELGLWGALAVGLGAALADGIYGLIAAAGLDVVTHFLVKQLHWIRVIGGVFLLYLAYTDIKNASVQAEPQVLKTHEVVKLVSKVFFLTLTNPMTMLTFIGIFASIGGNSATFAELLAMVLGVFLGSMTWWIILGGIIVKMKHKLPETWLYKIRYLSACILGAFGALAIGSVFFL